MAEAAAGSGGQSVDRRKGKRGGTAEAADAGGSPSPPCGACKFLRRKCTKGCIFAPHFGSDQGAAKFAAVHKVFGASNVSKLLMHIPTSRRHDAVVTISYEAQARLSDPVYGCVSTILALQHQVASLQAELALVQSQLINSRLAVANVFESSSSQQQLQHQQQLLHQQPSYSNNSSASTNLNNPTSSTPLNGCSFAVLDHHSCIIPAPAPAAAAAATTPPPPPPSNYHLFHPNLRLSNVDQDDDEQDSRAPNVTFPNHIMP